MRANAANRLLLSVTGILEAGTGLALLVAPSVLVELLLGAVPTGVGIAVSRVAGVAVLALGAACWLMRDEANGAAKRLVAAMLLYNVGVVVILVFALANSGPSGIFFWPVVLGHAALTAWCVTCLLTRSPRAN